MSNCQNGVEGWVVEQWFPSDYFVPTQLPFCCFVVVVVVGLWQKLETSWGWAGPSSAELGLLALFGPNSVIVGLRMDLKACIGPTQLNKQLCFWLSPCLRPNLNLSGWVGGWVVGLTGNITTSAPNWGWGLGLSLAIAYTTNTSYTFLLHKLLLVLFWPIRGWQQTN